MKGKVELCQVVPSMFCSKKCPLSGAIPAFMALLLLIIKNIEGTPNDRPEDQQNYIILMLNLRTPLDRLGIQEEKN